jgi:cytochrome c-type biogenesis protein
MSSHHLQHQTNMDLILLFVSFISGILTVLAPCVLPLLPVIIGGSFGETTSKFRPYIITISLAASLTIFTLLLKVSTALLSIDPFVWKVVSGGLVILFGFSYLFPDLWSQFTVRLGLNSNSDKLLEKASEKQGILQPILIGASLGPVFASCSPTYTLILATVLPVSFWSGLIYIIVYALGLSVIMLAISLLGKRLVQKLKVLANPNGLFRKVLGLIFLIVGISIILGYDKILESYILDSGFFDVTKIEENILNSTRLK